jgi:hypothetical protein
VRGVQQLLANGKGKAEAAPSEISAPASPPAPAMKASDFPVEELRALRRHLRDALDQH